jgi:hypothetical protein
VNESRQLRGGEGGKIGRRVEGKRKNRKEGKNGNKQNIDGKEVKT